MIGMTLLSGGLGMSELSEFARRYTGAWCSGEPALDSGWLRETMRGPGQVAGSDGSSFVRSMRSASCEGERYDARAAKCEGRDQMRE
jgi:hypothetical protein